MENIGPQAPANISLILLNSSVHTTHILTGYILGIRNLIDPERTLALIEYFGKYNFIKTEYAHEIPWL